MLAIMFLVAFVFLLVSYKFYGGFLSRKFNLDNTRQTPAECLYDGMDYCPTHPAVLMGHHFSSIAGAGPIVGPITAAAWFGWLPAYLWCLIGSAFFGGPHDMGSLVASIRHDGKSMGEVVRRWIGERGRTLFLCFTILTLFLIVAVFLHLASNTMAGDPAVAFSAIVYMAMAVIFGMMTYRFNISLKVATIVMLPIVFGSCWFAHSSDAVKAAFTLSYATWRWLLIGYVVVASLLPVWLLLQPRDYLASYFLYFAVIIGGIGMIFGSGFEITMPAFKGFTIGDPGKEQYLWPLLFITVACGAISGFHSMVGSGTSSKQLRNESDSLVVGYGSMLLEGLVAVIALGTVMIAGEVQGTLNPISIYASGFGKFGALVGIEPALGASLGALAINSFILTTVDTATRLTRYQVQEFTGGKVDKFSATAIAVLGALAFLFVQTGGKPFHAVIWPVFGAANQLVAALALLGVAVWLRKALNKTIGFLMGPMWFMLITTIAALGFLIRDQLMAAQPSYLIIAVCILLGVLALLMLLESMKALKSDALSQPAD
ncbi:MAG: Peptide transporter CstA [Desulfovibrio sp.]